MVNLEVFLVGMLLAKLRQLLDVHAKASPHGFSAPERLTLNVYVYIDVYIEYDLL